MRKLLLIKDQMTLTKIHFNKLPFQALHRRFYSFCTNLNLIVVRVLIKRVIFDAISHLKLNPIALFFICHKVYS